MCCVIPLKMGDKLIEKKKKKNKKDDNFMRNY